MIGVLRAGSADSGAVTTEPEPPQPTAGPDRRIQAGRDAHCAGATGFLVKDTPAAEILRAISRVAAGEPILSPSVMRQLIAHIGQTSVDSRQEDARTALARLSAREREVATAVGHGRTNAQIGAELFMSLPTVKQHVSSILTKLDLNNRTQIALLAHDAGLQ